MGHLTSGVRHAGSLYRKTFLWIFRPIRKVEDEVHHLHEVEQLGEAGETPFIAILGVLLFLLPIAALMMVVALGAASLAR
jgi:hypothetical protein